MADDKLDTELAIITEVGERIEHTSEKALVVVEPDARKCHAHTSGLHGAKRPCRNWAIKGGTVCPYHGGKAPQVKAAAQRRLQAMLDPALTELSDLIHQNEHLPSKLGAISNVMNRTLGKVGETKDRGPKGAVINIGFGIGAMPVQVAVSPEPKDDGDEDENTDIIDGDFIEEE
jgi:hypothetical protein